MNLGVLRGVMTLIVMLIFVGIVLWAYSRRRDDDFREAANLPLSEDEDGQGHE